MAWHGIVPIRGSIDSAFLNVGANFSAWWWLAGSLPMSWSGFSISQCGSTVDNFGKLYGAHNATDVDFSQRPALIII